VGLQPNADGFFQGWFTNATLAGEIEANPENYYLNIHSATFPAGAIRGQLGVQAAAEMNALHQPGHWPGDRER